MATSAQEKAFKKKLGDLRHELDAEIRKLKMGVKDGYAGIVSMSSKNVANLGRRISKLMNDYAKKFGKPLR